MIQRGEIYLAKLSPVVGSEQGGIRPVVIVQNNKGNRFSPTVIVAAITSSKTKPNLPTHIRIMPEEWAEKAFHYPFGTNSNVG